ncbi:hypothetical protein [Sphingobacterium sp.]|uniref:hypothetical protein n=1 Tax=unclassified Sphingobacterium TaxID=2609468 RepID=UPI0028B1A773|nr:hypothetical protein [Sphingobacterium sp.]
MEKLTKEQIEQFLKIEKETIASANQNNGSNKGIFDETDPTVSSATQTSTMIF